jgi:phosphoribosylformimino-5-aminoimidazole carboxamide ribotide isomerase
MTTFASIDIYPAIDLRHGQVVRLQLGDPDRQTTFSDDPLTVAKKWVDNGANWLHVVNLDGAFDEAGLSNWQVLSRLTGIGSHVQFGGGLRTLKDIARALNFGVSRVILGTMAVEEPDVVADAVRHFGAERIAVGIDAKEGNVKTRGWQSDSIRTPVDLGLQMVALGVRTVIYTDISRDGILSGVNASSTIELARETGLNVIASGGVASMADVRHVLAGAADGVCGLIIGRALYDGKIELREALKIAEGKA